MNGSSEHLGSLGTIEHIVVLMLENRSFDHMLGYLSLDRESGGAGRGDVDGLTGADTNFNVYDGEHYAIEPFGQTGLTKDQDPCHSGWCVGQQMANGMGGFAENYAATRAYHDPGDVMRYQIEENVPVYDFLAREFAVCDRWFCSVPGSTWPNRVASLTGEAKSKDNAFPPLYNRKSFVRSLPEEVTWRWYSSDPGSLRLVDGKYRAGYEDNFAYVERQTLVQPRTFFKDVMSEDLPNVAWIDPNFVDLGGLQGADDDHPPTDVMAAQSFVLKIYQALSQSAMWKSTMWIIVYDEHGGFYDHVDPTGLPEEFTSRAEFSHHGPRVPALVVSPLIEPGAVFGSMQSDSSRFLFDHCSLAKTILLRFAGGNYDGLPDRVASANDLGSILTADAPRQAPVIDDETVDRVAGWWGEQIASQLRHPLSNVPALSEIIPGDAGPGSERLLQAVWGVINWVIDHIPFMHRQRKVAATPEANELEQGIVVAAVEIRKKVPPGQP